MKIIIFLTILFLIKESYSQCQPGQYISNTGCRNCPKGTISQWGNVQACTPCPEGNYTIFEGSNNCTTCSENKYCPTGAAKEFPKKYQNDVSDVIDQIEVLKVKTNPQNIKLGSVVISFLLLTVPLFTILYACFDEDFFKKLDIFYSNQHYLQNGKKRKKKKTSMGGFFTVLVIALWITIALGCLSDFWFDNIFQIRSFALRKTPYKPRKTTIKGSVLLYNVFDANTCNAAFWSNGYDGKYSIDCKVRPESGCHCEWTCIGCSFSTQLNNQQTLKLTLNHSNAFTSMIGYQFDVETFFNDQINGNEAEKESQKKYFSINGTIKSPSNNVFYGSDIPSEVNFNIYDSNYYFIIGGNFGGPLIQLFNMFASITKWTTNGYVTELTGKFASPSFSTIPISKNGSSNGVSLSFKSQFLPQIYTVDENLKQNGLEFLAELLAWFVGLYFFFNLLLVFYEWFVIWAPQKWNDFYSGPYTTNVRQIFVYFDEDIFQKHFTNQFSWVRENIFKVEEADEHEIVEEAKNLLGEEEKKEEEIDIHDNEGLNEEALKQINDIQNDTEDLKKEIKSLKEITIELQKELISLRLKEEKEKVDLKESLETKLEEIIDIDKV